MNITKHHNEIMNGTKLRVAFTICYNALHHLKHNDFAKRMASMFHYWVIVEGAAENNGSTSWCHNHPGEANSTDGTIDYLNSLEREYQNVWVFRGLGKWKSKDDMCNHALNMLSAELNGRSAFLWQVDADEQWTHEKLCANEFALSEANERGFATTGAVRWNHFVSHDLIAVGDWGGNLNTRLWIWNPSQRFTSHEPPIMSDASDPIELPEKCNHYSYYFETDVNFKSKYYGGHEQVYRNWLRLQMTGERKRIKFPLHISYLFGRNVWIGQSNSHIVQLSKNA